MTPAEKVRAYCDAAGMKPDLPLRLALTTVMDAATEAREAVRGGARGLSPDGERELILRVSEAAGEGAERQAAAIVRRMGFGQALRLTLAALAIGGGGFYAGHYYADATRTAALEGGAFMAQLAELNDARALREYCLKHSAPQAGGTACQLPTVWVRRLP